MLLHRAFITARDPSFTPEGINWQASSPATNDIANHLPKFDYVNDFKAPHLRSLGILATEPQVLATSHELQRAAVLRASADSNDAEIQLQPSQGGPQVGAKGSDQQELGSPSECVDLKNHQVNSAAESGMKPQQQNGVQPVAQQAFGSHMQQASPELAASSSLAPAGQQTGQSLHDETACSSVQSGGAVISTKAPAADRKLDPYDDMTAKERRRWYSETTFRSKQQYDREIAEAKLSPDFVASRFACLKKIVGKVRMMLTFSAREAHACVLVKTDG